MVFLVSSSRPACLPPFLPSFLLFPPSLLPSFLPSFLNPSRPSPRHSSASFIHLALSLKSASNTCCAGFCVLLGFSLERQADVGLASPVDLRAQEGDSQ